MTDPNMYALFWDHIEELRRTLIRMLLIILFGTILSFIFYGPIISFLTSPITTSAFTSHPILQEERLEHFRIFNSSQVNQIYQIPRGTSQHLHSKSTAVEQLSPEAFNIPPGESLIYLKAAQTSKPLVVLGPLEGMLIALKTSLWLGVLGTSPIWLFVLMQFLLPGMLINEKRLILPFLVTSLVFIVMGFFFAFFLTIPIANGYLFAFNQTIGVNLWSLAHYLDYTLFLLLANGLAFELCAVGIFAVHLGLVSANALIDNRRFAIVAAFIIGALLTPPDVLTQLMLAIPLIILYEGVILYARLKKA